MAEYNPAPPLASIPSLSTIEVRLARTPEEIEAAQHLRYMVFYEEMGVEADPETTRRKMDVNEYDDYADHLIVIDKDIKDPKKSVVGTYRLLRESEARKLGRFFTASEFDITPLTQCDENIMELGRACVREDYRVRPVLQLLWQGIAHYVIEHDVDIMFGCGSFMTMDLEEIGDQLAYLHHFHLAPPALRTTALPENYIEMNRATPDTFDPKRTFASLPTLLKGYLRLGGVVGNGATFDHLLKQTDVCIIVQTHTINSKYRKHYLGES